MYKKVSQFLFTRTRDKIPALSKLINVIKKASLGEYVDKKISQFIFTRARDKIPALSKILIFPDDT
jgi:hypothetical protein